MSDSIEWHPMKPDRPSQEFHLTGRGWVSGTSKAGDMVIGETIERPDDAVETWIEEMVIAYPQCSDVYSWRLVWFDESVTLTERKSLRSRFPKPSDDFPM